MNHQGILNYIRDLCMEAADNSAKAPPAKAFLKDLERVVEECGEMIREAVVSEVKKYGKEGLALGGYHMTTSNGKTTYKYHGETWEDAKAFLDQIQEAAQLANRTGKPMPGPNGEVVEPATALYGKEGVTLRKVSR